MDPMRPEQNAQAQLRDRFLAMGLEAKLLEGERCVLASIALDGGPLPGLREPIPLEGVLFTTVGSSRIKCLRPRACFQLPMIDIGDCNDRAAIERRIREAWRRLLSGLSSAASWLEELGIESRTADGGSTLVFPLAGESRDTLATVLDRRRILLPSHGRLGGLSLRRPEDRVLDPDPSNETSSELEITLTNRMQEIARLEQRLADEQRKESAGRQTSIIDTAPSITRPVLLVGSRLADDKVLAQKLQVRGFQVTLARNENEAIALFDELSPQLVLSDFDLGRADGIGLVIALRQLAGIEEIPVVIVDEQRRASRRETAQRVGAAGYLVHPLNFAEVAPRFAELIDAPKRRRFVRFARRLSVAIAGVAQPGMATDLGRGGMFLTTEHSLPIHSMQQFELSIPELGKAIRVEAEVVYRRERCEGNRRGMGLRFERFDEKGEAELIRFLKGLVRPTTPDTEAK